MSFVSTKRPTRSNRSVLCIGPLVRGACLALALMTGAEAMRVTFGDNVNTVVRERCYRSGQPTPALLARLVHAHQIRTVISLRGENADADWYWEEIRTARQLHVRYVDRGLASTNQPSAEELRDLIHVLDEGPEPILLHCYSGGDRSGLAAVIYLLLKTDATFTEARGQLALRYGHLPWGRAACQDRLLDGYASWLERGRLEHRPEHLRRWARDVYRPEEAAGGFASAVR
jgi:protein tyrosine phosphatase (PTP) superfamily phosphohydrolase (DUF442 family)